MRNAGSKLLLTSLLSLLPAAAYAALGLDTFALTVEIEGTKAVDTAFRVTFTATGTDIGSASITPAGGTAIPLTCSGGTFCNATQSLANQAALDALLPTTSKNYTLTLTGLVGAPPPTVTDTIAFTRPSVPSPAISAPVDGSIVAPAVLPVTFSACAGTSCTLDSLAVLLAGAKLVEGDVLPVGSTDWETQTELTTDTAYTVQITHRTGGMQALTADGIGNGTDDDAYSFSFGVTHSDRVAFTTSDPPTGDFCIVVNDDDLIDETDCLLVDQPGAGVFDTGNSCTTSGAGVPIQYEFDLAPDGSLSGIAETDLGGDTPALLEGRLQGRNGVLRQKLRARFENGDARLDFRLQELGDLFAAPPLDWLIEQTVRGAREEEVTLLRTQPPPDPNTEDVVCTAQALRTGWKLRFDLTGPAGPASGTFELSDGVEIGLAGSHSFDLLTNQVRVDLNSTGDERGVRIRMRRLSVDETSGELSGLVQFRAYGQSGSLVLP